jgi:hypothetical protein
VTLIVAIASVVVAIAALIFSVASFWWIQARRGKLTSFPPQTFSGHLSIDSSTIRLPLSIFNNGAAPIITTDLRLRLRTPNNEEILMGAQTIRRSLKPESDDVDDFMHPICIPGRAVVSKHIEFESRVPPQKLLLGTPVTAIVEGMQDHGSEWIELVSFTLHVEIMADPACYITYSNQEHVWPPNLQEKAVSSHKQLLARIESQGRDNRKTQSTPKN